MLSGVTDVLPVNGVARFTNLTLNIPSSYTLGVHSDELIPATTTAVSAGAVAAPTVTNLQRFGFHAQPTLLVLTFSTALDPAPAENASNYRIVTLGGHGRGGNLVGHQIGVFRAVYFPATAQVELFPAERLDLHNVYLLTVNGQPPFGLTNTEGTFLDGKGNGVPGSDYTAFVTGSLLAGSAPTPSPVLRSPVATTPAPFPVLRGLGTSPLRSWTHAPIPVVTAPVPSGPLNTANHSILRRAWSRR
jgi:hypothetical protein